MPHTSPPRVLYCGPDDGYFKKLAKRAAGFQLEARSVQISGSPQKLARARRATVLIVKLKSQLDPKHQEWLSRSDASVPIIVLCQNGTLETAVQALQYRIFDYFSTDQNPDAVIQRIKEAVAWKVARPWKRSDDQPAGLLHGHNPEIQRINAEARSLAGEFNKPVVLYGEAGTGKEHLAEGMHRLSSARNLPFIRYDCRLIQQISRYDGIPVSQFVLTGLHELKKRHPGGVLFLQHLEQIHAEQRADILDSARGSSIRLIASCETGATKTEEEEPVPILHIPPLRCHSEDIPSLAEHFIIEIARRRKIKTKGLSEEVVSFMQEYPWPGNIQELANVVERMMIFEPSSLMGANSWRTSHGYGFHWTAEGPGRFSALVQEVLKSSEQSWQGDALYDQFMARMKKLLADLVLPRVDYNQALAAKVLGISRNTLREILKS